MYKCQGLICLRHPFNIYIGLFATNNYSSEESANEKGTHRGLAFRFESMLCQRVRKQWLLPSFRPFSNSWRCSCIAKWIGIEYIKYVNICFGTTHHTPLI
jgi:hypothetical protein